MNRFDTSKMVCIKYVIPETDVSAGNSESGTDLFYFILRYLIVCVWLGFKKLVLTDLLYIFYGLILFQFNIQ